MSLAPDEAAIHKVWSQYWDSVEKVDSWDSLSEVILLTLQNELRGFEARSILEAGCGTGRISHRLALGGADVTCLDITEEALVLAKASFGDVPGHFVQGSILDMPKDRTYDVIWNAGVLEHFKPEDQRQALSEFVSLVSEGGSAIILTPYSGSFLYRIGKFILEKLGRWPYGVEIPEATLAALTPENAVLEREYTIALLPLLFDSYKFLTPLRRPLRSAWELLRKRLGSERLLACDLWLSKYLGGYLLVSVLRPKSTVY